MSGPSGQEKQETAWNVIFGGGFRTYGPAMAGGARWLA